MKGSTKKICTQKMSIMFNEIYINEEMLPKCIYIYIYICVYVCAKFLNNDVCLRSFTLIMKKEKQNTFKFCLSL